MARLVVEAVAEDGVQAAPGNQLPAFVAVSVTRNSGAPVSGLGLANFQVDPMLVGAGGALVDVASVNPGRLPGCYLVTMVPIPAGQWRPGRYVFAVRLVHGADQGQALTSFDLD